MRTKLKMCDVVRLCVRWQLAIVQRSIGWEREREGQLKLVWRCWKKTAAPTCDVNAGYSDGIRNEWITRNDCDLSFICVVCQRSKSVISPRINVRISLELYRNIGIVCAAFGRSFTERTQDHKWHNTVEFLLELLVVLQRRPPHKCVGHRDWEREKERELYKENCILENGLKWSDHEHHNQ